MSRFVPCRGYMIVRRLPDVLGGDCMQWAYLAKVEMLPERAAATANFAVGQTVLVYLKKTPAILEQPTEERGSLALISFDDVQATAAVEQVPPQAVKK